MPVMFYGPVAGFLSGVLLALLSPLGYFWAAAWALAGAVCLIAVVLVPVFGGSDPKDPEPFSPWPAVRPGMAVALILIAAAAGLSRTEYAESRLGDPLLERKRGREVTLRGVVTARSERKDYAQLELQAEELKLSQRTEPTAAGVLVFASRYPEYRYGERVEITGRLLRPRDFEGDTGREFPYRQFLAKDGVSYLLQYPREMSSLGTEELGPLGQGKSALLSLRDRYLERLRRVLSEPAGGLAGAMLLGERQGMDEELEQKFRETGLVHIVVLSGFHLTMIALLLSVLFSRLGLPLGWQSLLTVLSLAGFAIMVGLGATVVRASIMVSLVLLSRLFGRRVDIHRSLLTAVTLMVAVSPLILLFDPSFQLSVAATAGLVYLGPLVERAVGFLPAGAIREITVATLATQLGVWPLLLYLTGSLSLVSLPVNLLVLPIAPAAMLIAAGTGLLGFVGFYAALPVAALAQLLLGYMVGVVEWFSRVPYGHTVLPPFPWWLALAAYLSAAVFIWWYWQRYSPEPAYSILKDI